jgi:hypothetical protein
VIVGMCGCAVHQPNLAWLHAVMLDGVVIAAVMNMHTVLDCVAASILACSRVTLVKYVRVLGYKLRRPAMTDLPEA